MLSNDTDNSKNFFDEKSEKKPMTRSKKIFIFVVLVIIALLLSFGIAMVLTAIDEQNSKLKKNEEWVPVKRDVYYTKASLNADDFICSVTDNSSKFKKFKYYKDDSAIELYNALNISKWQPSDAKDMSANRKGAKIINLTFYDKDEKTPENCYGCIYISSKDEVIYTTHTQDLSLMVYKAESGTYDQITKLLKNK